MSRRVELVSLRDQVRSHLHLVMEQAEQAQRLSVTNDNLCDVLDDMDNELQTVIELVRRARGVES